MNLRRSSTWAGLRAGDPVGVAAPGPGMRNATWEFVAHVQNTATGDEWVEVVGGRPGDRKVRSFRTGDVYPPRRGRPGSRRARPGTGAPSLADAPRLPFS